MDYQTSVRNSRLYNLDPQRRLLLQYTDSHFFSAGMGRPVLGGLATGWHYMPAQGDQIGVLQEWPNRAMGTVSLLDPTTSVNAPFLNPGESACYSPNDNHRAIYVDNQGNLTLTTSTGKTLTLSATASGTVTMIGTLGAQAASFTTLTATTLTATTGPNYFKGGIAQQASTPSWSVTDAGAATVTSVNAGSGTIATTGQVQAASFSTNSSTNKITGILVFSSTVSATLTATTFTNPTASAPAVTWPTVSGGTTTVGTTYQTITGTGIIAGYTSSSNSSFAANALSEVVAFSGVTGLQTVVSTINNTAASINTGGASVAAPAISGGSVTIGKGTLTPGWTITNVAVGDFAQVSIPALDSHPEVTYQAAITATNTVVINYVNASNSTVTLTTATVNLLVLKAS